MHEAQRRILSFVAVPRFAHVVTFGSEMAMYARRDPAYRALVNAADLVVPDTIGIVQAARMLGCPVSERVPGIELVDVLCAACAQSGVSVFLLGGEPGVAQTAAVALSGAHPKLRIAGTQHGYFDASQDDAVASKVRESGAALAFVALGFPRQEFWIHNQAATLEGVTCMGVGGTFDVISGKAQRAPSAARRLGLEWLYRLVREPRRLGRQLALPQFAVLVALQALRERRTSARSASGQ
ncbi:MAG TPA: WecB/TagA/CpsF family glycosyltransferase [Candidatus Acidoferrales bacterium]|nr:WecB/TagA/CpsF family glycosyltransferase [Candidatus Acidoferrales bacterium]